MLDYSLSADKLAELRAVHRATREKREADRIKAVILLAGGWSAEQVAEALLIDANTVRSHFRRYREGGLRGLLEVAYRGSDGALDAEALAELEAHLTTELYLSAKDIAAWVKARFGVSYTVSGMTALLHRIPIVKSIYSSVKQVSDTLFSSSGNAFREAVLVQYPRPGAWTIAFVTGKPGGEVATRLPGDYVSIYVPTTPNPTSGFFLMLPRADVVALGMSVDEALKYVISMGVVAPPAPAPT